VLGTGQVAQRLVDALQRHTRQQVLAVAPRDADGAAAFPGRHGLATALQALSQLVTAQDARGEWFDERTVEAFGHGAVLLYYRVAQQQRTIQVVELLWLG
jgi:hypothetical protein